MRPNYSSFDRMQQSKVQARDPNNPWEASRDVFIEACAALLLTPLPTEKKSQEAAKKSTKQGPAIQRVLSLKVGRAKGRCPICRRA
jgi:hypothetical protein